ncbi:dnab like replicative helicase [Caudoviricetes sp.]|nr:dnab like replicative helicase [Caudoviricetes sp.]
MIIDEDAILAEVERVEEEGAYEHYRPLMQAADEFIAWAETPQDRVYTGIKSLDKAMRGTAPGEVTLIQGFTHSGKTLVATELMKNNPDVDIMLVTPDETRPLVLTKLASAVHGQDIRDIERRIQQDDESARAILRETAERFSRLAVFDDSVTTAMMSRFLDEVEHATGHRPVATIFDYATLLEGPEDVKAKIAALKAWGKRERQSLFIIHQASRTSGSGGKKMGIDSGEYGGETAATHVIGVRRKKYAHFAQLANLEEKIANSTNSSAIERYETQMRELREVLIPRDENTITISLNKNKRPPCELVDDEDYMIDAGTGALRRIEQYQDSSGGTLVTTKAALRSYTPKPWEEREMF